MELSDFSDLHVWPKLLIMGGFGLFFYLGESHFAKELDLYDGSSQPNPEKRETIPVHVVHGSLRNATAEQAKDWDFWKRTLGPNIGVPFLIACVVWVTGRRKRS